MLCVFWGALKRGSLQLLRNVSRLIITWSVHFIFGTSRQEFVSSLETSDTLLPMEQCRRERGRERERERDYHECAAEYPTNCHRVPTGAVNTNDSMEPCGIHTQPPGQGDHISEVAGPFASFLERTLHSFGLKISRASALSSDWLKGLGETISPLHYGPR